MILSFRNNKYFFSFAFTFDPSLIFFIQESFHQSNPYTEILKDKNNLTYLIEKIVKK